MRYSKLIISVFLPFLFGGCANPDNLSSLSGQSYIPYACSLNITVNGMLRSGVQYNAIFDYKDSYFNKSAKEKDDKLRNLSYAASIVAADEYETRKFFNDIHFDDATSFNLNQTSQDSVGYFFAHRKINEYDLISVAIRGLNYHQEWANNFVIGETGNHLGFDEKSNDIYESLRNYVSNYSSNIKIWISGYSRAGSIANCLVNKLLKEKNNISVKEDDLFVYTFEAPRSLSKENSVEYLNVWNYFNKSDLIASILPTEYNLYRCGREIALDEEVNVESKIEKFDKDINFPKFTSTSDIQNENQFINYIVKNLLKEVSDASVTMHNRKAFFTNYQSNFLYLSYLLFYNETVENSFKQKFLNSSISQISNMFLNSNLFSFVYPILDEHNISYESNKLKNACDCICNLVKAKQSFFNGLLINESQLGNLRRVITMHYPDVVLALIQ